MLNIARVCSYNISLVKETQDTALWLVAFRQFAIVEFWYGAIWEIKQDLPRNLGR